VRSNNLQNQDMQGGNVYENYSHARVVYWGLVGTNPFGDFHDMCVHGVDVGWVEFNAYEYDRLGRVVGQYSAKNVFQLFSAFV